MKFKVGDIIKGKANGYTITNEDMKEAEVKKILPENCMEIEIIEHEYPSQNGTRYEVVNQSESFELIERKEFTKSDLKDEDIVILRNGVKYRKSGNTIQTAYAIISLEDFTENLKDSTNSNEDTDIIKVERPTRYETVYERVEEDKKEILDETEREYLKAVIKPFKNKIGTVCKVQMSLDNKEYLIICLKNKDYMTFPTFEKGTMYKGMKTNVNYTLKELELDDED